MITGAREPLSSDRLAADVVVIDAEAVRRSAADSVADLLRREAGVQISRNGGPGQSSSVLLRGAAGAQTAVFVDGVRIGSATLGLPNLAAIPLSDVERIEVLRGPGSSLFGADTVGGVVNVFTRRGRGAPKVDAALAAGGYGSMAASAGGSAGLGAWDLSASVSHERSDGVSVLRPGDRFGNFNPDRDGFRSDGANARIGFTPAEGQRIGLALLASRLDSQYDGSEFGGPPDFAQDNTPDFRNRSRLALAALDWRGAFGPSLVASAKLTQGTDRQEGGGTQLDTFRTTRRVAGGQLAWQTGVAGQLVGALERTEEKVYASNYGIGRTDVDRHIDTLVLALTGAAGPWSWQTDARRDVGSDFGGVSTGRLGGAFALAPGWKLRALAGTTFRAPSFNDLYFPDYGVPTIRPERGRSVEAGLSWRGDSADWQATVYRNRVRDLIAYEPDNTRCPDPVTFAFGCAANVASATLRGATLSGSVQWGAWALRGTADFVDAKDDATGQRLPRRAAHQESLGLDWTGGHWRAGAEVLRLGGRVESGKALAPETTLDLKAAWRFAAGWQLEAKLLNATDRDTEPARDYQGLGRQAWLGLRFSGSL